MLQFLSGHGFGSCSRASAQTLDSPNCKLQQQTVMFCHALLQVAETGVAVPERPRLRQLLKSFSTGTRSAEKMHNVKENVKQLLMPWKRKLAEAGGEELQNNDDFGVHPVLQVRPAWEFCCCWVSKLLQWVQPVLFLALCHPAVKLRASDVWSK